MNIAMNHVMVVIN